jgi:hypothetical protein
MPHPLLVPRPDSGLDSGPSCPCSSDANTSNFKRMHTMILVREVCLQDPPVLLLSSLTTRTVLCFSSCRRVILADAICSEKIDAHTITYQ